MKLYVLSFHAKCYFHLSADARHVELARFFGRTRECEE